ncbi:hypothetical protein Ddc_07675 [Ditylenchus destructor]|nr:hypothetical protein Ddc_07675 [Ditylenchus destructor]
MFVMSVWTAFVCLSGPAVGNVPPVVGNPSQQIYLRSHPNAGPTQTTTASSSPEMGCMNIYALTTTMLNESKVGGICVCI